MRLACLAVGMILCACSTPGSGAAGTPPPLVTVVPAGSALPFDPIAISSSVLRSAGCKPVKVAPGLVIPVSCGGAPRPFTLPPSVLWHRSPGTRLPRAVDLRDLELDGPVLDQGSAGVCWSFAVADVMDNALRRAGQPDVVAPLHVLSAGDPDKALFDSSARSYFVTEKEWPYDPVTACRLETPWSGDICESVYGVRPGTWRTSRGLLGRVQRANDSGRIYVSHVTELAPAPDPEDVAALVAQHRAVYVDLKIDSAAWASPDRRGVIASTTAVDSLHAVAVVGYRTTPRGREFLVHNSWGKDWDLYGYGWMPAKLMSDAWMVFTLDVGIDAKRTRAGIIAGQATLDMSE